LFVIFLTVLVLVTVPFVVVRFVVRVTVRFLVCAKEAEAQNAIIKKTAKIDFFILFDCFVFYILHLKRGNVQDFVSKAKLY